MQSSHDKTTNFIQILQVYLRSMARDHKFFNFTEHRKPRGHFNVFYFPVTHCRGLLDILCSAMPTSSRISIPFAAVSWRALPAQRAASAARIGPCESRLREIHLWWDASRWIFIPYLNAANSRALHGYLWARKCRWEAWNVSQALLINTVERIQMKESEELCHVAHSL